jgi:hypothetical protein
MSILKHVVAVARRPAGWLCATQLRAVGRPASSQHSHRPRAQLRRRQAWRLVVEIDAPISGRDTP